MGKRGPKPTPTAALARRGSWRAKERQGEPEPALAGTCPEPPKHLAAAARKVWRESAPAFWASGILTLADANAFERYCEAVVFWRRVNRQLAKLEDVTKDDAATLKMADEMLRRAEAAFGANPADRVALKMEPKSGDDAKEAFLERPRLIG